MRNLVRAAWAGIARQASALSGTGVVRLAVTSSTLIVCSCIVLSWVLLNRHLAEVRTAAMRHGAAVSAFVAREAELATLAGDRGTLQKFAEAAVSLEDVRYCQFVDGSGLLLAEAGERPQASRVASVGEREPAWDAEAVEFATPILTRVSQRGPEEIGFAAAADAGAGQEEQKTIGQVRVGMSLASMHAAHRREARIAGSFTIAIACLAVMTALLLTLGPLRALASTAELAAERARVAELRSRFVAQASHEFRTPLAVILAAAEVLLRYGGRMQPAQHQERLAKIRTSVRHMTDLLDDVLTIGRADAGRLPCARQLVDLRQLCQDIVADVQAGGQKTHEVVLTASGLDGQLWLDPKLVRQVLRNLVTNAIKYSPAGGRVSLAVHHDGGVVRFEVRDQGIGISPEDQAHLFEPFHRGANVGKAPGTGLGLAITHRAVTLHGGTIGVQSTVGTGTTFVVSIPVEVSPHGHGEAAGSESRGA